MANRFRSRLGKFILSTDNNLVSLEKPFKTIVRLLKGQSVTGIIDAGASNGHVSRRFLQYFPGAAVYAFEPNPLYTEQLKKFSNEEKRFKPNFLALSDHAGSAELHITQAPGSTSLLVPLDSKNEIYSLGMRIKSDTTVEVDTIDNWISSNGNPDIQIIKFDIQGGELSALKGASNTLSNSVFLVYTEIIFIPLYQKGARYSEIDLFLWEYGFELYDIYTPKYNSKGQLAWANAIFVHSGKLFSGV